MVAGNGVSIFTPIVFLVVVELASVARSIELEGIAKQNRPAIELYGVCIFPNLGRFSFIHFANMMLLAMTAFASIHLVDGVAAGGLLAGTAVLLYFLPLFEVDEYDGLLSAGALPASYWKHLRYVTYIIGLSLPGVLLILAFHKLGLAGLGTMYLILIFTAFPFLAARAFTRTLQEELITE